MYAQEIYSLKTKKNRFYKESKSREICHNKAGYEEMIISSQIYITSVVYKINKISQRSFRNITPDHYSYLGILKCACKMEIYILI